MNKLKPTRIERELLRRLEELELRLSVLENIPTPIIWAVTPSYPTLLRADMQAPTSEMEH